MLQHMYPIKLGNYTLVAHPLDCGISVDWTLGSLHHLAMHSAVWHLQSYKVMFVSAVLSYLSL